MEPLFPKVKASQERIYRMAERLARDHTVNVATRSRPSIPMGTSSKGSSGAPSTSCSMHRAITRITTSTVAIRG